MLDDNKDKRVTESDFENLAVKYLCQGPSYSQGPVGYGNSNILQGSQASQGSFTSQTYSSNRNINLQTTKVQSSGAE